jgi:hypothetical protein
LARLRIYGLCAAALLAAQSAPFFRVQRLTSFVHRHSPTSQKYLPETMSGGLALIDYDGDGRLDLFLVNGGHLDDPVKMPLDFRRGDPVYWNRLYRQQPDGTFSDVTAASGLAKVANVYGMGAAVGDIDNDGDPDLYVTAYGRNTLYRNQGGSRGFEDATDLAGVAGAGWSVSAAFLDYDRDGWLDLFVARYLDWDFRRNLLCGTPFHAYCRPDKFEGMGNLLFHNEGGGRFRDVSESSGIGKVKGKGMGVAVNDYDGDGWPDVFVSNDGMEQFLFRNQTNGTFAECALEAGVALSDDARSYAGMGVAFADYNNDGRPDLLVTNLALEKYALYRNEGAGGFTYVSQPTGLAALTARSSGWGVGLHDFDNDGEKDIFAAQSHVLDNVERIHSGLRYLEPPVLFRQHRGRFMNEPLGNLNAVAGRGAAFGDLNNDGAVDVVVTVLGASPLVLLNTGGKPGLTLKLEGAKSNRDGAGAVVTAGSQTVYATTSGSYLSANDGRVHLSGSPSRIEIIWPGGKRQTIDGLAAGRVHTIKEKP